MPVAAAVPRPTYSSAREVLSALLHDLAQPVSALECSTEVALLQPRSAQQYLETLEQTQELAIHMHARLRYFRELARAVAPCDCMHPVPAQPALTAALEQIRPVAESLGTTLEGSCAEVELFGNHDKLVMSLMWILDHLLAFGNSATLQLKVDGALCGEVHIRTTTNAEMAAPSSDALTLAQTALATMGVEVQIESRDDELMAKLQLSSYRHPADKTLVIVGDF